MRWSVSVASTKAERVRESLRATRERRRSQRPVVYQLKLQGLSKAKRRRLDQAFREAKWLYNWLVSDLERLSLPVHKVDRVEVKVGDRFEERELSVLGSQVKQGLAERIGDNLRALAELKKQGHPVGPLRPKRFLGSIPLKQYGNTYELHFGRNRARVQKLGEFRVLGLHQIPPGAEIANAVLVKKPSGYYLHVTCYLPKNPPEGAKEAPKLGEAIGIDPGVASKLTLSNGLQVDFAFPETPRLKKLQKVLARKKKGSRNREALRGLLRREYERIANRRKDAHDKVLAFLKGYGKVAFQEDPVAGWKALFGPQIQASGIGGLLARLRESLPTPLPVARFEATTQECFACGRRHTLSLSEREMRCPCGWTRHRDWNAALVILRKGLGLSPDQAVGLDRPELTPLEREAARRTLGSNPGIRLVFLGEGGSPPL
jgi:putative transposase